LPKDAKVKRKETLQAGRRHEAKAAVAFERAKPLEVVDVDLDGPRAGEVLIELKRPAFATPTLSRFQARIRRGASRPSRHEGAGIVGRGPAKA